MLKYLVSVLVTSSVLTMPAWAQSTAYIFAPPSNIRNAPNGEIICSIPRKRSIIVRQKEGQWYYTDACGGGYIHQSQLRFQGASQNGDRARVVGIKKGQLAVRATPNGRSLGGLNNGNVVKILDQQNNWAYVRVIQGPNARVRGLEGWVNSYYLSLF